MKDLATFVAPQASTKWYYLGLQLFDQKDVVILDNMKKDSRKDPIEQCIDVLNHWLLAKKSATWNKLIKGLKSDLVKLPNLAESIYRMLDHRVGYC